MKSILKLLFLVIIITSCSSEVRQPLSYSCFDIVQNKTTGLVGISVGNVEVLPQKFKEIRYDEHFVDFTGSIVHEASVIAKGETQENLYRLTWNLVDKKLTRSDVFMKADTIYSIQMGQSNNYNDTWVGESSEGYYLMPTYWLLGKRRVMGPYKEFYPMENECIAYRNHQGYIGVTMLNGKEMFPALYSDMFIYSIIWHEEKEVYDPITKWRTNACIEDGTYYCVRNDKGNYDVLSDYYDFTDEQVHYNFLFALTPEEVEDIRSHYKNETDYKYVTPYYVRTKYIPKAKLWELYNGQRRGTVKKEYKIKKL